MRHHQHWYHRWHHMSVEEKTLYLTEELKAAVRIAAARQGVSEAEVIRRSIRQVVGTSRPRPRGGLFSRGHPIARRTEELLEGFGER